MPAKPQPTGVAIMTHHAQGDALWTVRCDEHALYTEKRCGLGREFGLPRDNRGDVARVCWLELGIELHIGADVNLLGPWGIQRVYQPHEVSALGTPGQSHWRHR